MEVLPEENWEGALGPNPDEVLSPLKVHGLIPGRAVDVPLSSLSGPSVAELRAHLSSPNQLPPPALVIIQNGRRLEDDDLVREVKINSRRRLPVFAFVRSRLHEGDFCDFCEVRVGPTRCIRVSPNSRIDEMKERLYAEGLVSLPPSVQQLILAGRVCHDSSLLGDHLLFLPPSHRRGPPQLMVMSTSSALTLPSPAAATAPAAPAIPAATAVLLLQSQRRRASKGTAQRQRSCTARFKGTARSSTRTPLAEIMRLYAMSTATRSPPATPV